MRKNRENKKNKNEKSNSKGKNICGVVTLYQHPQQNINVFMYLPSIEKAITAMVNCFSLENKHNKKKK